MPVLENDTPEMENIEKTEEAETPKEDGADNRQENDTVDLFSMFDNEEEEPQKSEKKSLLHRTKEWLSEKLNGLRNAIGKAIQTIKDKIPVLGRKGGLLDRLETRVLGGKDAYNKIYSVVTKEEADKTIYQKENLPSTIQAELNKPENNIGINNGEKTLIQDADLQKRYMANAYTIGVDGIAGSMAYYTLNSTDDLSSVKVPGKEAAHGAEELKNVEENMFAFKTLVNKFRANIADGKDVSEMLPNKPYVSKDSGVKITKGSFDIGRENILKVTVAEKADNRVDLSIYNFTTKSKLEIKKAESFSDAVKQAEELINASERATKELAETYAEHDGKEHNEIVDCTIVNTDALGIGDIIETQNGRLYEIKDGIDVADDERIFFCGPIVLSQESGNYERANENQIIDVSSKDIKDIHKDISLDGVREVLLSEQVAPLPEPEQVAEPVEEHAVDIDVDESLESVLLRKYTPPEKAEEEQLDTENADVEIANNSSGIEEPSGEKQETKETEVVIENGEAETEPVADVIVEAVQDVPEQIQEVRKEPQVEPTKDEDMAVKDIISKGGHDYRVTKIDEVRNCFYVKPVTFDETKGSWISIGNKADAIALERSGEYDIKEKAPQYTPQKNDTVITDDGKIGVYVAKNKVRIDGELQSCKSELLQKYTPPEKAETISSKDILDFEVGGEEKPPSLDDAVSHFGERGEDIEIEMSEDELEMSSDF